MSRQMHLLQQERKVHWICSWKSAASPLCCGYKVAPSLQTICINNIQLFIWDRRIHHFHRKAVSCSTIHELYWNTPYAIENYYNHSPSISANTSQSNENSWKFMTMHMVHSLFLNVLWPKLWLLKFYFNQH